MMTCRDTLEWLLEAEPSELREPGDPGITEHLASCHDCRSRLVRITGDTAWLARAVPVVPPDRLVADPLSSSRRRWTRPACAGAALLAATLLIVFLSRDSRPARSDTAQAHHVAVAPAVRRPMSTSQVNGAGAERVALVEQVPAPARLPVSSGAAARLPVARAVESVAITTAFVPPTPARAVRLDTTRSDRGLTPVAPRASFAVDADPATGRYAVLQSTPKVTVVWFY